MHSWELSNWRLPATVLDTLYPLKMTPLPGYWDADHDRPRTRNARHSNAQCNNIFISKPPTFILRTQILPLAAIRLAAHRKYTVRKIRQKTSVAPLCEWKNLRAERLNYQDISKNCINSISVALNSFSAQILLGRRKCNVLMFFWTNLGFDMPPNNQMLPRGVGMPPPQGVPPPGMPMQGPPMRQAGPPVGMVGVVLMLLLLCLA